MVIIGLLLLINPDIEFISAAGALLMSIGLLPLGMRELKGGVAPQPQPETIVGL